MNILEQIMAQKNKRLAQLQAALPLNQLVNQWERLPPRREHAVFPPRFYSPGTPESFSVIAEIKRASPSKGRIPWALSLEELLQAYREGGAALVSVLTEEDLFLGSNDLFRTVRQQTSLPLLRKDFLFTEYQVYESALLGADVILLIATLLDKKKLETLIALARHCGLQPFVECRNEAEIAHALEAGASLLGINNRDLRTFEIDLHRTEKLHPFIPPGCFLVSESGILTPEDAARVSHFGANAVLVGESCVRSARPAEHIRALHEAGLRAKLA